MLELTGAAGMVGLAGCNGGNGDDDETETDRDLATPGGADDDDDGGDDEEPDMEVPEEIVDKQFVMPQGFDLENIHFNPYNPGNMSADQTQLFSRRGGLDRKTGDWVPNLVSDWDFSGETLDITVDDRFTWQTGDDVTAEDLVVDWKLGLHMGGGGLWDYADSVEVVDTHTARINLGSSANRFVILPAILESYQFVNRMQYGEYVERFEEAQGDMSIDEARETADHKQIQEDLRNFAPRGDEVIGNGPFELVEQGQQRIVGELYEDHPKTIMNDGRLNFSEFVWRKMQEGVPQAFLEGDLDGREVVGFSKSQIDNKPDGLQIAYPPVLVGTGVVFDRSSDIWGRRNVRAALAYVVNRELASLNASGDGLEVNHQHVERITGVPGYVATDPNELWLGDDADKYSGYAGTEKAFDQAASLLEEEGFSQEDGDWYTPDGDRWSVTLKSTSADNWLFSMRTVSDHMDEFGIENEVTSSGNTTYFGQTVANGDFDVALNWWGGGNLYPYFGYNMMWNNNRMDRTDRYPAGGDAEVEVPQEIGDFEGNSGMETVQPRKLVQQLGSTSDEGEQEELIKQLAWVFNYDLPTIPLFDWVLTSAMWGEPEWLLPDRGSQPWRIEYPVRWLMQDGKVAAMEALEEQD